MNPKRMGRGSYPHWATLMLAVIVLCGAACRSENSEQPVSTNPGGENTAAETSVRPPSEQSSGMPETHTLVVEDAKPAQPLAPVEAATGTGNPGLAPTLDAGEIGRVADPADMVPSAVVSDDVLQRSVVAEKAEVKHILVGWRELAAAYRGQIDPRAAARNKADADAMVVTILTRLRNNDGFDALMREYSEDAGSASTAKSYLVTEDAALVPPFKSLSLRLNVNEVGLVETAYGWHVIKRIQ